MPQGYSNKTGLPLKSRLGSPWSKEQRKKAIISFKKMVNSGQFKKGIGGNQHFRWNGGKTLNWDGRLLIWNPSHPNADRHGYVRRSRLVAEKCLGRYLMRLEVIHHINGDLTDDRPENLYLFPTNFDHLNKFHKLKVKPVLVSNL